MNKILFFTFIAMTFIVTNCYSQDERWIFVADDESLIIYYDKETIKTKGNEITVNLKFVIKDNSEELKDVDFFINKTVYNCGKDYYKILRSTIYHKNGKISMLKDTYVEDIIPDTIGEDIYRYFCKQ